ncbi:MAG: hypothetical protein R6U85_07440 [Salinivirgaceae bacterium]
MSIKSFFQNIAINKAIKKNPRKKRFKNLEQIKHVGIIFERTGDDVAAHVAKLAKFLHERQMQIEVIAFVNLKKPTVELEQKKGLTLFYKRDLNWFGKPKSDDILAFTQKKFDLLIKADFSVSYPLAYICASSEAGLIAGSNDDNKAFYDLIIEGKIDNPNDFHQQLIHYLSVINSTESTNKNVNYA